MRVCWCVPLHSKCRLPSLSQPLKLGRRSGDNRIETGDDRIETGDDRIETGDDRRETGDDRIETGDDRIETGDDRIETGDDKNLVHFGLVPYTRVCE